MPRREGRPETEPPIIPPLLDGHSYNDLPIGRVFTMDKLTRMKCNDQRLPRAAIVQIGHRIVLIDDLVDAMCGRYFTVLSSAQVTGRTSAPASEQMQS